MENSIFLCLIIQKHFTIDNWGTHTKNRIKFPFAISFSHSVTNGLHMFYKTLKVLMENERNF